VTASGILNIAGYTDVKVAIDGKQPTLTGSSNITTGTINATNVTASGNITTGTIAATDITTSGTVVSEWMSVCKQRVAICRIPQRQDGNRWKAADADWINNNTTGTITASNITGTVVSSGQVSVNNVLYHRIPQRQDGDRWKVDADRIEQYHYGNNSHDEHTVS
jgi:hypothetical protein